MIELVQWIVALGVLFTILGLTFGALTFAPFLPSPKKDIRRGLKAAGLKKGELLIDLGSGNGRVCFIAAGDFQAKAKGYEIVSGLWLWSRIKAFFSSVKEVGFYNRSLFSADITEADVIFLYGMPGKIQGRLLEKLVRETKAEARIVTYRFSLKHGGQFDESKIEGERYPIFLYQKI